MDLLIIETRTGKAARVMEDGEVIEGQPRTTKEVETADAARQAIMARIQEMIDEAKASRNRESWLGSEVQAAYRCGALNALEDLLSELKGEDSIRKAYSED